MSILRDLFLQHQAQTSTSPVALEVARAEGVYLYDTTGKKYVDLISGIAVSNVGHCAPEVVKAIQEQAASYMHTMVYGEYVLAPAVRFAEAIVKQLQGLDMVYFVNSGAEAVEGALKIAKKYTGRKELIAFQDSYHGSTHGALSVTGNAWIKEGYGDLLPHIQHLEFNNFLDLERITSETAAVLVEPIQGEAGIRLPKPYFLHTLRQRCSEVGALLIFDEIQTGFGRTGDLFVHQTFGVQPDILLMAKGMGGGMPIGAFAARKEVMAVISDNPILGHITTFGGHPVTCAAGLACLNKILDEKLLEKIPAKAEIIAHYFTHPAVKAVRGMGLMWIVELDTFENTLAVVQAAMRLGVITDWFLNMAHGLRIAPPLTITEAELRFSLAQIEAAIVEVYG